MNKRVKLRRETKENNTTNRKGEGQHDNGGSIGYSWHDIGFVSTPHCLSYCEHMALGGLICLE